MPPFRILVVDDSAVSRRLLTTILDADPMVEVVGEATNGVEAIRLVADLQPDLVTMDSAMPVVDGLEATRRIMEESPRPIVIVSSSLDRFHVQRSFAAVEAGAVAVLEKPAGPGSPDFAEQAAELVRTVKLMAEVKVVSRSARRRRGTVDRRHGPAPPRRVDVVAIAASTGGPAALASILRELPADLSTPIVVVQHIPPGFDAGFAEWLDSVSALRVRLAASGQALRDGEVVVAPGDAHIEITAGGRVALDRGSPIDGHRPSATHLFRSIARTYGSHAVGVILTGMGRDGAAGLLELKRAGGLVLAQDDTSSVVFGMPGAAIALGIVDEVLPLDRITERLAALVGRAPGR